MDESNDSGYESSVESGVETDSHSGSETSIEVSDSDISTAYDTLDTETPSLEGTGTEDSAESKGGTITESSARGFSEVMAEAQAQPAPSYETLTDKQHETLAKPAETRSWHETEVADSIRHSEYATQLSFTKDTNGNIVEAPHGEKGSHRPDGIRVDEQGRIDVREVKDYHNKDALMQNMAEQAADRYAFFGEDTEVTFAIAANDFTVEEASQLQDYVENTLHANIDWINK